MATGADHETSRASGVGERSDRWRANWLFFLLAAIGSMVANTKIFVMAAA